MKNWKESIMVDENGNSSARVRTGTYNVRLSKSKDKEKWVMQIFDKGTNFVTSKFTKTWDDERSHDLTVSEIDEVLENIEGYCSDI